MTEAAAYAAHVERVCNVLVNGGVGDWRRDLRALLAGDVPPAAIADAIMAFGTAEQYEFATGDSSPPHRNLEIPSSIFRASIAIRRGNWALAARRLAEYPADVDARRSPLAYRDEGMVDLPEWQVAEFLAWSSPAEGAEVLRRSMRRFFEWPFYAPLPMTDPRMLHVMADVTRRFAALQRVTPETVGEAVGDALRNVGGGSWPHEDNVQQLLLAAIALPTRAAFIGPGNALGVEVMPLGQLRGLRGDEPMPARPRAPRDANSVIGAMTGTEVWTNIVQPAWQLGPVEFAAILAVGAVDLFNAVVTDDDISELAFLDAGQLVFAAATLADDTGATRTALERRYRDNLHGPPYTFDVAARIGDEAELWQVLRLLTDLPLIPDANSVDTDDLDEYIWLGDMLVYYTPEMIGDLSQGRLVEYATSLHAQPAMWYARRTREVLLPAIVTRWDELDLATQSNEDGVRRLLHDVKRSPDLGEQTVRDFFGAETLLVRPGGRLLLAASDEPESQPLFPNEGDYDQNDPWDAYRYRYEQEQERERLDADAAIEGQARRPVWTPAASAVAVEFADDEDDEDDDVAAPDAGEDAVASSPDQGEVIVIEDDDSDDEIVRLLPVVGDRSHQRVRTARDLVNDELERNRTWFEMAYERLPGAEPIDAAAPPFVSDDDSARERALTIWRDFERDQRRHVAALVDARARARRNPAAREHAEILQRVVRQHFRLLQDRIQFLHSLEELRELSR